MTPWDDVDFELLTARNVACDFGVDVLNEDDELVEPLTGDPDGRTGVVVGGQVERVNHRAVHASLELELLRVLPPMTRVRPWQTLTAGALSRTYPLGVFVVTTIPDQQLGETPATVSHEGYDKLHLLQHSVGDTYVVAAGTGFLDAVRQAILDAGVTGLDPLLAGDAEAKTLTEPFVWVLDPSDQASWIRVINDLLAAVGYRGLWVDHVGRFRSEPYQTPSVRPVEWTWDLTQPRTSIVLPERTLSYDERKRTNFWRGFIDGYPTQPVDGDGRHTIDESAGGTQHRRIESVTAADQASLVAQVKAMRDADTRTSRHVEISCGPFPVLGHFDVTQYVDPEAGSLKVMTGTHTIPLNGRADDVSLELEVIA